MRIWNAEENAHKEAILGMMFARPEKYRQLQTDYGYGLYLADLQQRRVRIIINGGGGYGPMWPGFADEGLADAMVHGDFNCAPNAYVLYEMARKIECGCGVLFLANHFMGDYLNNEMAVELLAHDGISAKACYVSDDILSCAGEKKESRGGLHGIAQACKAVAATVKEGASLGEAYALAEKVNQRLRSVSANIHGRKLLFGQGFSGEPATVIKKYENAGQLVREACDILLQETEEWREDAYYISVNSNSSVGYTESFVLLHTVSEELKSRGLWVQGGAVGTYFDVFEGSGCMISLLACDRELQKFIRPVAGYGFVV